MKNTPNVKYIREELKKMTAMWRSIRIAILGAEAMRANAKDYVPHPDKTTAETKEGAQRFKDYITRAVWYGATASTVDGMLGQIFARDPVYTGPKNTFDMVLEDVDGAGMSLNQQARDACLDGLSLGRGGLFVDYTYISSGAGSTAEDVARGESRPYIRYYKAEDIINWREKWVNGRKQTTLVVVHEEMDMEDDGYEVTRDHVWRELRLFNGVYYQCIWIERNGELLQGPWVAPTKADGTTFDEIPFSIIGSMNNDFTIDPPPMRDIVEQNIAHFRNSADYEESCFICGQPTLFMSGMTEHWVKNVLDGAVTIGSRSAVPLPTGATPVLLQAQPNTMIKEAMDQKERLMVALGAKLIDSDKTERTLGEVSMEAYSQNSVLSRVSRNVSDAYTKALGWCADFMGVTEEVEYELNTDFDVAKMSPEELTALISAWQSNAISFTEMRWQIKKGGRGYQDDDEMRAENEQEDPLKLDITQIGKSDDDGNSDDDQNDPNNPPAEKDEDTE